MNEQKYKELMTALAEYVILELKKEETKAPEELKALTEAARIAGNAYLYSVEVGLGGVIELNPHEL